MRAYVDEQFGVVVQRTYDVVGDRPEFVSRFRWRAERRCRRLEAGRLYPSYRYEAVPEGRRWAVWAFQNIAVTPPSGNW